MNLYTEDFEIGHRPTPLDDHRLRWRFLV